MRTLIGLFFGLVAFPAVAADWALNETDRILDRHEVDALTAGQTLVFYDDGQSKYSVGGAYSYTYASGESAFGRYEIEEDGTVCISYRNGFSRCDRYVQSGERIILLTEKGLRFPVRPAAKK
ncbi:hypothetical protein CEP88_16595 [Roseobacter denitrificans]|nr:hypothetical protein [Roseobacter denitrificans]AVL54053.1 hypothetical protein CEP88_16595 [Roseobacter denitrificans]SFG13312.1 hypothetical protein SAMN05443635_10866 [Roseobacter denitrificans OCh 114]